MVLFQRVGINKLIISILAYLSSIRILYYFANFNWVDKLHKIKFGMINKRKQGNESRKRIIIVCLVLISMETARKKKTK